MSGALVALIIDCWCRELGVYIYKQRKFVWWIFNIFFVELEGLGAFCFLFEQQHTVKQWRQQMGGVTSFFLLASTKERLDNNFVTREKISKS